MSTPEQTTHQDPSSVKRSALFRILKATTTLPGQVTFYAAALGAILLIPGTQLPPTLATIASGLGINALSSILEQIARGEHVSDHEICKQVEFAIKDSSIAERIADRETQGMIARLFHQCDLIAFAIKGSEHEILERLTQQMVRYEALISNLHDDLSSFHYEIQHLGTRQQGEDIKELQRIQLQGLTEIKSLLMRHIPSPEMGSLTFDDSLPEIAKRQLALVKAQAELSSNPINWQAWLKQATTYYELEEFEKALIAINKAWEINHGNPEVISVRGCIFAEYAMAHHGPKSMVLDSIRLFESLRGRTTVSSTIDYNIGNCYAGLGDHKKAILHFDKALALKPNSELAAQIWKNRGTAFYFIKDRAEEIASYKQALELNPTLYEAYASWGATELHDGNFQHARELLEKAFEVDPDRLTKGYEQLYSLAYTLWRLGKLDEAYQRVCQVLSIMPAHEDGLLLKALLLSQLWRKNPLYVFDAIAFFENSVIDNPTDMRGRNELRLIYHQEEDGIQVNLLRTALSSFAPPQALYHYAILLEQQNRPIEAIKYLEAAFSISSEHHITHSLGRLKMEIGDFRGAIQNFEKALQDVKDPVSILHNIADCYHFLREYKNCVRILATTILANPRDRISWANLEYALVQMNEHALFNIFVFYLIRLDKGDYISDEEAKGVVEELFSRLRVRFGKRFV